MPLTLRGPSSVCSSVPRVAPTTVPPTSTRFAPHSEPRQRPGRMAPTVAAAATAGDTRLSPPTAAAGGEPGIAAAATTAPGTATAADAATASASSKWHAYYASDPTSAPWDTHGASSQLCSYLCGCAVAAGQGGAQGTAAAAAAAAAAEADPAGPSSGGAGALLRLHACQHCAGIKPPALVEWLAASAAATAAADSGQTGAQSPEAASDGVSTVAAPFAPPRPRPPRGLELCCGTGGSLAFMRSLGFHVVGAELVEAACGLAAERLAVAAAAAAAAARGSSSAAGAAAAPCGGSGPAVVVVEAAREVSDGAARECGAASGSGRGSGGSGSGGGGSSEGASPEALLLHGDLFAAAAAGQIAPQSFDFVYDCQGLHAMPPELRPAYVRVLGAALRPGGTALVLVGRREADGEVEAAAAAAGVAAAVVAAVAEAGSGNARGEEATRPGPSLMSLSELECLFPWRCGDLEGGGGGGGGGVEDGGSSKGSRRRGDEGRWEWLCCSATRFDWTPAYRQRPVAPPAWCLLLRRC